MATKWNRPRSLPRYRAPGVAGYRPWRLCRQPPDWAIAAWRRGHRGRQYSRTVCCGRALAAGGLPPRARSVAGCNRHHCRGAGRDDDQRHHRKLRARTRGVDSLHEVLVDMDCVVDGRCYGGPARRAIAFEFANGPHSDPPARAGEGDSVAAGSGAGGPSGCDWPRDLSPLPELPEPVGAAVRDASSDHDHGLAVWLAGRVDGRTDRLGRRDLVSDSRNRTLLQRDPAGEDGHPAGVQRERGPDVVPACLFR